MFTYELLASVDQEVGIVIVQVGVPVLAVRGATLPRPWSPPPRHRPTTYLLLTLLICLGLIFFLQLGPTSWAGAPSRLAPGGHGPPCPPPLGMPLLPSGGSRGGGGRGFKPPSEVVFFWGGGGGLLVSI